MGLKDDIRRLARDEGFDLVGFARLDAPAPGAERLREWIALGRHATMEWMARDLGRRADPRLIMPSARSIVCTGVNYRTVNPPAGETGRISRYAWGDDYHDLVGKMLERLLASIREIHPGVNGRAYVDTGPVMEKAWAERAGLGWQGKHTNLISQEIGSWFFLGELLLDAEIEPDAPETDHCGNCALCIEACPTGAITGPYVLDAGLCISYLTIEHRGPFPPGVGGPELDGWLFGCDVCQEVCPWNDRSPAATVLGFLPREGATAIEPAAVQAMSDEQFRKRFKGSAVRRAKPEGLRRNAGALREAATAKHEHPNDDHGTNA